MKKLNNKGFTLVELIVTISILSVVVAISANTFFHLWGNYQTTQEKWQIERDIKNTISKLDNTVKLSYKAQLNNFSNISEITLEPFKRYFYFNEVEGNLYFIDYDFKNEVSLEPALVNQLPINVSFTNKDETGIKSKDMLYISVASIKTGYSLSSAIYLANLTDGISAEAEVNKFNTISFNLANEGTLNLTTDDVPDACFIATAAYGDLDQPNVMLLRQFRDNVLSKSKSGQEFINFYYKYSPKYANIIAQNQTLRLVSRICLTPFIGVAICVMHPFYGLIVCFICLFIYKFIKDKQILKISNKK